MKNLHFIDSTYSWILSGVCAIAIFTFTGMKFAPQTSPIYVVQFEVNSTQVAFTLRDAQLAIPADGEVFSQYRVTGGGNGVRVKMVGGNPRVEVDNSAGGITRLTLHVTLTNQPDRFYVFWDVPNSGAGQYLKATVNGIVNNITNHEADPVFVK